MLGFRFFSIMRKNVFGRQFRRDANERKALFKSLLSALVLEERIKTTEEKAKAIKGQADKLITLAHHHGKYASRWLQKYLTPKAVEKLVAEIAPRFVNRQGGYTRFARTGNRVADNATMAYLEWTEKKPVNPVAEKKKTSKKEILKSDISKADDPSRFGEPRRNKKATAKTAKTKAAAPKKTQAKKSAKKKEEKNK